MKVGDYIHCLEWDGSNYTTGHQYPIVLDDAGALIIHNNHGHCRHVVGLLNRTSQFCVVEASQRMPEPEFDLDDMELAEILIEEMK